MSQVEATVPNRHVADTQRRDIGKLSRRSMVLGLAILLGLLLAQMWGEYQAEDTSNRVAQAQALRAELFSFMSHMEEAETEQRGYLLTGDESEFEHIEPTRTAVGTALDRLRRLVAEAPWQIDRTIKLKALVTTKLEDLDQTLSARRNSGLNAAVAKIQTGVGTAAMAEIRALVAEMVAIENRLLIAHLNGQERLRFLIRIGQIIGLTVFGAVAIFLNQQVGRAIRSHRQSEEVLRNANQTLEKSVAQRTAQLSQSKALLAKAEKYAELGSWTWHLISGEREWSDQMYRLFGLEPDGPPLKHDELVAMIHPSDRQEYRQVVQEVIEDGEEYGIDVRLMVPGHDLEYSAVRGVIERDHSGIPITLIGTVQKITARKKAEEELKRSNEELAQFAYVASHDLQEPLRMVSSYLELLSSAYEDKLDSEAQEFIAYAVEGAHRMRNLINDLLTYSRAGAKEMGSDPVDSSQVVSAVIKSLGVRIAETDAEISYNSLPIVKGDQNQLFQLFQNLIENGIKFCRAQQPRVSISAEQENEFWHFQIADNGIGIDPKFHDRIFDVFKRLNARDEFPGTGIGLAVCKRIVARHGGRIWVESNEVGGSTFHFTVPSAGDQTDGDNRVS